MKKLNNRVLRMESLEGRELMATLASPLSSSLVGPVALVANDDTMANANNVGTVYGWTTQADTVSGTDRVDYYKFQVGASGPTKIDLTGMSRDIDISILDASGRVLGGSAKSGTAAESVTLSLTAGATYYVKVMPYATGGSSSNYTLRIEALAGNDTRATATNFGTILAGKSLTAKSGLGGSLDTVDYYRFDVGPVAGPFALYEGTRSVTISLTELNADADIEILDSNGNSVGSSRKGGTTSESLTLTLTNGRNYYVKVTPFNGALTDYRLTISAR